MSDSSTLSSDVHLAVQGRDPEATRRVRDAITTARPLDRVATKTINGDAQAAVFDAGVLRAIAPVLHEWISLPSRPSAAADAARSTATSSSSSSFLATSSSSSSPSSATIAPPLTSSTTTTDWVVEALELVVAVVMDRRSGAADQSNLHAKRQAVELGFLTIGIRVLETVADPRIAEYAAWLLSWLLRWPTGPRDENVEAVVEGGVIELFLAAVRREDAGGVSRASAYALSNLFFASETARARALQSGAQRTFHDVILREGGDAGLASDATSALGNWLITRGRFFDRHEVLVRDAALLRRLVAIAVNETDMFQQRATMTLSYLAQSAVGRAPLLDAGSAPVLSAIAATKLGTPSPALPTSGSSTSGTAAAGSFVGTESSPILATADDASFLSPTHPHFRPVLRGQPTAYAVERAIIGLAGLLGAEEDITAQSLLAGADALHLLQTRLASAVRGDSSYGLTCEVLRTLHRLLVNPANGELLCRRPDDLASVVDLFVTTLCPPRHPVAPSATSEATPTPSPSTTSTSSPHPSADGSQGALFDIPTPVFFDEDDARSSRHSALECLLQLAFLPAAQTVLRSHAALQFVLQAWLASGTSTETPLLAREPIRGATEVANILSAADMREVHALVSILELRPTTSAENGTTDTSARRAVGAFLSLVGKRGQRDASVTGRRGGASSGTSSPPPPATDLMTDAASSPQPSAAVIASPSTPLNPSSSTASLSPASASAVVFSSSSTAVVAAASPAATVPSSSAAPMTPSAPPTASAPARVGRHVMLSYSWAYQPLILSLAQRLRKVGFMVWLDVDEMHGSTLEAMASAVEGAAAIVYTLGSAYKNSANCRLEAEYAAQLRRPMIPIMVERRFRPDGWLGIITGSKLYYSLAGDSTDEREALLDAEVPKLVAELERHAGHCRCVPSEDKSAAMGGEGKGATGVSASSTGHPNPVAAAPVPPPALAFVGVSAPAPIAPPVTSTVVAAAASPSSSFVLAPAPAPIPAPPLAPAIPSAQGHGGALGSNPFVFPMASKPPGSLPVSLSAASAMSGVSTALVSTFAAPVASSTSPPPPPPPIVCTVRQQSTVDDVARLLESRGGLVWVTLAAAVRAHGLDGIALGELARILGTCTPTEGFRILEQGLGLVSMGARLHFLRFLRLEVEHPAG